MYIALRWLIGLSFAMWVAVCCIHYYTESSTGSQYRGYINNIFKSENITNPIKKRRTESYGTKSINRQEDTAVLHYAMFFAGVLAVSVFNRKKEILLYTRRKIIHVNVCTIKFLEQIDLKRTALIVSVAIVKYSILFWKNCKQITENYLMKRKALQLHHKINLQLLNKLKEYAEERQHLGHILIAAIRENKNIRMRYQIATSAKQRLLQGIEDSQKQLKENRSKYVRFQHLYLVTHQENIYLKNRLKKVCKEKEDAQQNFMSLINEIYHSNNHELKEFCSRFIVGTRQNLLNSDMRAEIQKFLQSHSTPSYCHQDSSEFFDLYSDNRITEILPEKDILVPLTSKAPKLKGLPGECIWTVKDKDGIIEKLYECDYDSNVDKGDTIRRIRKYSVYHDKDCLLDFANSRTTLGDLNITTSLLLRQQYIKMECPIISHRFLTGSQVFQKFLQDNQNLTLVPTSQNTAMVCE